MIRVRVDNHHRSEIAPPAQFAENLSCDGSLEYELSVIDNLGACVTWASADDAMSVKFWGRNILNELDYGGYGHNSGYYFTIRIHWAVVLILLT
ncbi:MAG: hypothetical protein KTR16_12560 [Acidiferrobacterales bacterium]|nr:hypothetical protein [Acidiferrobacterales bacterium]